MNKSTSPEERIILALDVPNLADAQCIIERARPYNISWVKVGLELLMSAGAPRTLLFLKRDMKMNVFCDGKFFDTPKTVERAVQALKKHDADMFDVSVNIGLPALRRAAERKGSSTMIINTMLSSLDVQDIWKIGYLRCFPEVGPLECYYPHPYDLDGHAYMHPLIRQMTRVAMEAGADGITCPASDLCALDREEYKDVLKIATGVRLKEDHFLHQHKRLATPYEAMRNGADKIVVGSLLSRVATPPAIFTYALETILEETHRGLLER